MKEVTDFFFLYCDVRDILMKCYGHMYKLIISSKIYNMHL